MAVAIEKKHRNKGARAISDRFWPKVNKEGPTIIDGSPCWVWIGSKHAEGYGHFRVGHRIRKAHQVSYELANGPLPPKMLVCHRCDNTNCVNPAHLYLGTNSDNGRDALVKDRNTSAKLTVQSVKAIRRLLAAGVGKGEIAAAFEIHPTTVATIKRGKTWVEVDAVSPQLADAEKESPK